MATDHQQQAPARRGRPKVTWIIMKQELWRVARYGRPPENAWAAAKYLEGWVKEKGIAASGKKATPPKAQAIYKRLCRRIGGAPNFPSFIAFLGCQPELPKN